MNLPVRDLAASVSFFARVGYPVNERYTDPRTACLMVSDDIFVMLMAEPFFRTLTGTRADPTPGAEVIMALGLASRAEVDSVADQALAAGARSARPADDQGFMYTRTFADLDGHLWELFWLDPAQVGPDGAVVAEPPGPG